MRYWVPLIYKKDWRKLNKTNHVKRDRERMERYSELKHTSEVILALRDITSKKMVLHMDTGNKLILNEKGDCIITVLPKGSKRMSRGPHKILWDIPDDEIEIIE